MKLQSRINAGGLLAILLLAGCLSAQGQAAPKSTPPQATRVAGGGGMGGSSLAQGGELVAVDLKAKIITLRREKKASGTLNLVGASPILNQEDDGPYCIKQTYRISDQTRAITWPQERAPLESITNFVGKLVVVLVGAGSIASSNLLEMRLWGQFSNIQGKLTAIDKTAGTATILCAPLSVDRENGTIPMKNVVVQLAPKAAYYSYEGVPKNGNSRSGKPVTLDAFKPGNAVRVSLHLIPNRKPELTMMTTDFTLN